MARVALVTGGSRGIGAAISKALKAAGYNVAATYSGNDEAAAKFKAETGIPVYKGTCRISMRAQRCRPGGKGSRPGGCAGQQCRHHQGRHVPQDDEGPMVRRHQHQPQFAVQHDTAVWEGMRARKFGRVICISSVNGQKGQMGQVNYSASKAGDIGFVKALAQEGAKAGITVNAICPGISHRYGEGD